MAVKTSTRSCQVTSNWEYAVTGYTPTQTTTQTVRKSVTVYQDYKWYAAYGEWATYGSSWTSPSGGSNVSGSPSAPSGSGNYDGEIRTQSASGSADFTEQVTTGGDPIYGWVGYGASHNHPASIAYDDGEYAGTLYVTGCNGSAPSPGYSGSPGEVTTTSGTGTATYSGDVPLKPDTTAPTVTINSHNGENSITINWSATDNRSLRDGDTFALYISGPNNNTLAFKQYVGKETTSFTFTSDGTGSPFIVNAVYLARVVAVDSSNNTGYADRYVTFKKSRPPNFSWSYGKGSGQPFNLTDDEWNALLVRINEFRVYKGFTQIITFAYADTGADFRAYQFNQATDIINSMSPPTPPPAYVSAGNIIYASQLNGLVTSLNSIP